MEGGSASHTTAAAGQYLHLTQGVVLGHGQQLFTRAGDAVLQWQLQVRAGLRVSVSKPHAMPGNKYPARTD
jgi:uncharacterized protein (UPF0548 family)